MAYVYICEACRSDRHEDCEERQNTPTDPEIVGGGVCICSHKPSEERTPFERSVWERED